MDFRSYLKFLNAKLLLLLLSLKELNSLLSEIDLNVGLNSLVGEDNQWENARREMEGAAVT